MKQTEVTAALGLLKFAFPPLQPEAFDDEDGTSEVRHRLDVHFHKPK